MKRLISLLAAALTLPSIALAANDGLLERTSNGSLTINLAVTDSPNIQISGFEDVALSFRLDEGVPDEVSQLICIYMDAPGTFDLGIEAGSLNDEASDTNFPYTYTFAHGRETLRTVTDTVRTETSEKDLQGLTPSFFDDCNGSAPDVAASTLSLVLAETPATATTQTATATITMTVTPN